jgi:hypothetical protein
LCWGSVCWPRPALTCTLTPLSLQGRRFSRPKRLHAYRRWVDDFASLGQLSASVLAASSSGSSSRRGRDYSGSSSEVQQEWETGAGAVPGLHLAPESEHDKLLDTIMLRLRLAGGVGEFGTAGGQCVSTVHVGLC